MSRPLRVVHCPVNTAGIPWQYVQALRRRGTDAQLVVFNRGLLHPAADVSLDRPTGFLARQVAQFRAQVRLLPQADIFHFYFGLTLIPKSVQFLLLRAAGKRSVYHFLGSDIRGRSPAELAFAQRADAQIVGNLDDRRWLPDAEVVLPGVDLHEYPPTPAPIRLRPLVVHAPSNRSKKGTEDVIRACESLPVELEIVEGLANSEARQRYAAADIVIDQLKNGWYGVFAIEAMAMGKPVVGFLRDDTLAATEREFGVTVPIISATSETLAQQLRPLVNSAELRKRIGASSRRYAETVHDVDRIAGQLTGIYERIMSTPRFG
jgi:hypothetical protein